MIKVKAVECCSCRMGENHEPDVAGKFSVRNPDDGRFLLRGHLCDEHLGMYEEDGYEVRRIS